MKTWIIYEKNRIVKVFFVITSCLGVIFYFAYYWIFKDFLVPDSATPTCAIVLNVEDVPVYDGTFFKQLATYQYMVNQEVFLDSALLGRREGRVKALDEITIRYLPANPSISYFIGRDCGTNFDN